MDARIKTFQLSLAIHALIFAAFVWYGKSVPLPDRLITVDFAGAGSQSQAKSRTEAEGKKENAKALDRPRQSPPAREHEQTAASQMPESEPPLSAPVEEKPVKPSETMVGWAAPTDDWRAQPALPSIPPFAKGDSGGFGSPGTGNAALDESDSVGNGKSRYLKEHFAYIRDTVMKNLSYPAAAKRMGWEGKAVVSFVISEDGYASDIKIVKSSGFGVLDRNAIETVKKSSPFPRPPARAELVMPIVYKIL